MPNIRDQIASGELDLPPRSYMEAEGRRRSLAKFVKYYWPIINPSTPLQWNWHLDVICKHLQKVSKGEIQRLIIAVPPGSCKSSLVSVFWPCFEWLTGNYPSAESLYFANAPALLLRDSEKCRHILESPEYREDMRLLSLYNQTESWEISDTENSKEVSANTAKGKRSYLTVLARATGVRSGKTVIDDPVDVGSVINAPADRIIERMAEINLWYKNKIESRRNNVLTDPEVLIMQRVHTHDLAGVWLRELDPSRKQVALVIPMEYDPDAEFPCPEDPRTEPGELFDKNRYTPEWVKAKKADPDFADQFEAQYNQRPISLDGDLFKKEFFDKKYPWLDGNYKKNPHIPQLARIFTFVDCANTVSERADFTVFGIMGQALESGDYYLLFLLRLKLTQPQLITKSEELLPAHNTNGFVVEDAGNGIGLIQHLDAPDSKFRQYNIIAIKRSGASGSKEMRAQNTLHVWQKGRVWVPDDNCPWMTVFRNEHLNFPQGLKDDQVDMMSMAIKYFEDNRLTPTSYIFSTDDGNTYVNGQKTTAPMLSAQMQERPILGRYPTPAMVEAARHLLEADQGQELWKVLRAANPGRL